MAKREEYIDKLDQQLREWNTQINKLQEKASNESQDLKAKLEEKLDDLREKRRQMKTKSERIKSSGDDVFTNIKKDTEKLWGDVKRGISEIREIVKE